MDRMRREIISMRDIGKVGRKTRTLREIGRKMREMMRAMAMRARRRRGRSNNCGTPLLFVTYLLGFSMGLKYLRLIPLPRLNDVLRGKFTFCDCRERADVEDSEETSGLPCFI